MSNCRSRWDGGGATQRSLDRAAKRERGARRYVLSPLSTSSLISHRFLLFRMSSSGGGMGIGFFAWLIEESVKSILGIDGYDTGTHLYSLLLKPFVTLNFQSIRRYRVLLHTCTPRRCALGEEMGGVSKDNCRPRAMITFGGWTG